MLSTAQLNDKIINLQTLVVSLVLIIIVILGFGGWVIYKLDSNTNELHGMLAEYSELVGKQNNQLLRCVLKPSTLLP